ncbi:hypothetical protein GPDM_03380 [Planococcus donghaensis MPA1U2]|uniref:Uncharacterized protein n=1 Tax=Planococcus donghaensis MPA1U2 TaxID=933115 RepID=E7RDZ4_9BACL|nr:hypothetical protein [Planococcus donghaensis]EGA90808.1 hypothetical protein GPDM_03380 [Planococcus donghaensis MPA1U2]
MTKQKEERRVDQTKYPENLKLFIAIWTLFVQSNAVGEAHRFSAWKGFFVIVIPAILFVEIIVAITVAITMTIL